MLKQSICPSYTLLEFCATWYSVEFFLHNYSFPTYVFSLCMLCVSDNITHNAYDMDTLKVNCNGELTGELTGELIHRPRKD